MARTLKDYDARRGEILEAAIGLVYTKGYEQMAIQDILDLLQISKGAFYHYFTSKTDLLEGIIERMSAEAEKFIVPIASDPDLPALKKLDRLFAASARWKTDRKEFFFSLLRVWYTDDNAIVRQKVYNTGVRILSPYLTQIIHQGLAEGVLTTPFPNQMAEVVMALLLTMGDRMAYLILDPPPDAMSIIAVSLAVNNDALERLLGAPAHSLQLIDLETIREWIEIDRKTLPVSENQQVLPEN